ncbi:hypothetical protein BKA62DRAFT_192730 [Auriculariales sp. MPI-PUGE-AT-0066]|nr:hypothetical protein BKA62DRAFT_192730 [Auriculariales sp. MPI-PUGE-AT-0066]
MTIPVLFLLYIATSIRATCSHTQLPAGGRRPRRQAQVQVQLNFISQIIVAQPLALNKFYGEGNFDAARAYKDQPATVHADEPSRYKTIIPSQISRQSAEPLRAPPQAQDS